MNRFGARTSTSDRAVPPRHQHRHPRGQSSESATGAGFGRDCCVEAACREPVFTPQVVVESWAVGTRPVSSNGLGWAPTQMAQRIDKLVAALGLVMLADTASIYEHWRTLVEHHAVSGKQVHDARIVAVMLTHGVSEILTFNDADFRRYTGIAVLHPSLLNLT